ncbi:hypothetical protein [Celeribacter marinus]|uniref:hypothetical protein n=1 Tax=Celeribacter marinus TaxID=1397108 RepID=UPI00316CD1A0
MTLQFSDADYIYKTEKELIGPYIWRDEPYKNEVHDKLESRVQVSGGVARGVFFRVTVMLRWPDSMMFQLECDDALTRTHHPLYRLDVNPLAPHSNRLYGSNDINGLFIEAGRNHEHIFYDSVKDDNTLRKGQKCAQQARQVMKSFAKFEEARDFVCDKLNIQNGHEIAAPTLQGYLL